MRIPSAAAFIVQKILVHSKRGTEERAKDFLYIHDTIELFGRSLSLLNEEWRNTFRHQLHGNAVRIVEKASSVLFSHVIDIAREAALMATGRSVSPAELVEVCRVGCGRLFCASEIHN